MFVPVMNPLVPLIDEAAPGPKKKKDKFDQIDAAVRKVEERAARALESKQSTFYPSLVPGNDGQAGPTAKRLRIIVGGADRIENLWPRQ